MNDNDSNDPAGLEVMAVPKAILKKLLHHAEFAAHRLGHLDDDKHAELISQIGDHIDTIAHRLTEILGEDAAAPDVASNGALMLAASAGGAGSVRRRDDLDVDDRGAS